MIERRYSWNQPMCDRCWLERRGNQIPHRLVTPRQERCSYCGEDTLSGIYVRDDPVKVAYPALKKEEDEE